MVDTVFSLLEETSDFKDSPPAKHVYVVAATERSGGTYLCFELWRTGLLGAPAEYLNFRHALFPMVLRLQARSPEHFMQRLTETRTSPNGVFGLKLHWPQLQFLVTSKATTILGGAKWIFNDRRDKVAQAVSFSKALKTQQWLSPMQPEGFPDYSFESILRCHRHFVGQRNAWMRFFKNAKITPLTVFYEDFTADRDRVVSGIVDQLGFPRSPRGEVQPPRIEKQADEINLEWAERFRREAAQAGFAL